MMQPMQRWLVSIISLLPLCAAVVAQKSQQPSISLGFGAIEGRVVDARSGNPIAHARVFAESVDPSRVQTGKLHYTYSGASGEFFLAQVQLGVNLVSGAKEEDGYPNTYLATLAEDLSALPKVTVKEREVTKGVILRLSKGGRLIGRVTDAGTGGVVKAPSIRLTRVDDSRLYLETTPDLSGHFKFVLPARPFKLEITAPGYAKWTFSEKTRTGRTQSLLVKRGAMREMVVLMKKLPEPKKL